ncbi:RtcB family protein [Pseudonocardia sp. K10HN5]|uniref:tRNA-splicing ligase RtcB n=2 Tax=Pseudonocardia acidicola TaxID=2724939 RepID=A0ABX1S6B2_9PSEU|nr:RtcB family protein [Pseudonocardia acidicola]NMH96645.1 RtcB family protein [Pseudonocardia acidicola]
MISSEQTEREDGPTVFDSVLSPADPTLLARLHDGTATADLAAPPVVLPDFCHKAKSEMPSSIAVATRGAIRPTLTDAALNCGMALATLDVPKPSERAVGDFYRRVRERFPSPPGWKFELTRDEVLRAAVEGADFAADRYGIERGELDRVEEFGRIPVEEFGGAERARKELPWLCVQLARLRFGTIGPSTHFLELQQVEEILDPAAAERLGVHQGQVTVQFHNGGGVLTGQIGEMYARRKSASRMLRAEMAAQKPLTHLLGARSLARARRRFELYFTAGCPSLPVDGDDGRRVLLAQRLSMNYGFAYRLATYAALRSFAREAFGARMDLVVDSPHNSIYEEDIDGAPAYVHRHNAARAWTPEMMAGHPAFAETGQPLLLPGTNRTSSFLCVPAADARRSLYTACHGTGSIISAFVRDGRSGPDPLGRHTACYSYSDAAPREVAHLDDLGVGEGLDILVRNGLVRPVARMRPFAVLS